MIIKQQNEFMKRLVEICIKMMDQNVNYIRDIVSHKPKSP